jgi:hypothetical protein
MVLLDGPPAALTLVENLVLVWSVEVAEKLKICSKLGGFGFESDGCKGQSTILPLQRNAQLDAIKFP